MSQGRHVVRRPRGPRFRYSRQVIVVALAARLSGATWEASAASCTADGQVDSSVLKRWQRRFELVEGRLVEKKPPDAPFPPGPVRETLPAPVGSWGPDPKREDHWARSPPPQP